MTSSVIPTMKYDDAPAAIKWLCAAFGFREHLVVAGGPGIIAHAQLVHGNGMIMLGTAGDSPFDALQKIPRAVGGIGTQSAYVVVADVDAHHQQAVAAGAEIVMAPADQEYGGRRYACRDPEGHLWNFGSYDPWASPES
jgi:uncharacterized glyoxalase superfamily protein PhnB